VSPRERRDPQSIRIARTGDPGRLPENARDSSTARITMKSTTGKASGHGSPNGATDPAEAREIGLRFSSDEDAGIQRRKRGRSFQFLYAYGAPITDKATLERIAALAIPPAWSDVWICSRANGHLQATGRDARGRKQYRYHSKWRAHREETKFGRMAEFGRVLPAIRARVEEDLHRHGLPREKVMAAVIALLERTRIRVGNDEYARANKSFGLTTLLDRHASIGSTSVRFHFRGKSGKEHEVTLQDRRLARIIKRCQDMPGQRLFQYEDEDGNRRHVGSAEVNDYLRETAGEDYTAKDFRTWAGTVIAAGALRHIPRPETDADASRDMLAAIDAVADDLGNTRAVARASYIHPAVFAAYQEGSLQAIDPDNIEDPEPGGLDDDEKVVLALLSRAGEKAGRRAAGK
jgi:DNA topoisomerase-1